MVVSLPWESYQADNKARVIFRKPLSIGDGQGVVGYQVHLEFTMKLLSRHMLLNSSSSPINMDTLLQKSRWANVL